MFNRVCAAAGAAAVAAMLLSPAQSIARGGAGMAGPGGGFHPPVRPTHPVRPLVRRHDPLFAPHEFRGRHGFEHRHDRRNADGSGGSGYGGSAYGGNGYGDNGYGGSGYGDNGYGDNGHGGYGYCSYGYRYSLACGGFSAFYGRYYDPSDVPGSAWVPPYTVRPASVVPIAARAELPVDRGGCRSETVTTLSPGGADRSVTITRC